jgi:hypothetical protein
MGAKTFRYRRFFYVERLALLSGRVRRTLDSLSRGGAESSSTILVPLLLTLARDCNGGKNCDLASQGIVTVPDSHGQAGNRKASAKSERIAVTRKTTVEKSDLMAGARALGSISAKSQFARLSDSGTTSPRDEGDRTLLVGFLNDPFFDVAFMGSSSASVF